MVEHFARVSSPLSLPFFQQSGGAMRRGHTAYAHRDAGYNLVLTAQWLDPGESERHVRWIRELWQALRPYATGGVYVNHIGREDEDGADQVRAAYGTNYPASGGTEAEVRPYESVPAQPEHQADRVGGNRAVAVGYPGITTIPTPNEGVQQVRGMNTRRTP